ncbi:MAG: murein transglycosylase [Flavobacteriaceae bacterium]|nr:murein transglycosylase [Flavobacteriaceae bacterium]|tara:strand:+ start:632 stop:1519 length:888 start_codon:yes stop_codon:yes gene_type:complete
MHFMNSFKVLYFLFVLALFSQCTTLNSTSPIQTNTQIIPTYPQSISFAGEVVYLDKHYVLERLDRELLVNNFWHSNSILVLKRAAKYFPIIEPILQENGIPDDFKYLAVIESGLTHVVSPAGAEGFWQFMPQTARDYGLEVNGDIDERLHLIKATESAAAYLIDAYAEFGNWTLAAAAYNAGVQRIKYSLEKQQTKSYYDLHLNEETSRYMYRILATKLIFESPERYGFVIPKAQTYLFPNTKLVKVSTSPIDWVAFAQSQNMSYADFRELNPWIKGYQHSNRNNKEYEIRIFVD